VGVQQQLMNRVAVNQGAVGAHIKLSPAYACGQKKVLCEVVLCPQQLLLCRVFKQWVSPTGKIMCCLGMTCRWATMLT
jgi:hypothetical protein